MPGEPGRPIISLIIYISLKIALSILTKLILSWHFHFNGATFIVAFFLLQNFNAEEVYDEDVLFVNGNEMNNNDNKCNNNIYNSGNK